MIMDDNGISDDDDHVSSSVSDVTVNVTNISSDTHTEDSVIGDFRAFM